jgi:MoaA/NifB/PqqE/SkfB family radical SAM enzyme
MCRELSKFFWPSSKETARKGDTVADALYTLLKKEIESGQLSDFEHAKRNDLASRKPYIASKLAANKLRQEQGFPTPVIRLAANMLCNFQCNHCCAEHYMDRHLLKLTGKKEERHQLDLNDIRELSRQADEFGLARFVLTGGEPLLMRNPSFDEIVEAIDPEKHYIITDTNGWFMDLEKAKHIKSIGVEKVQLSLDSSIETEHDAFRNKKGSFKRVMRAVDACLEAGLNLILSTCLVRDRVKTDEFLELCEFSQQKGIGLYVTYAKPVGNAKDHLEWVILKEDADYLRELEKKYNVFTHMTPSYGMHQGCITVKGIVTVSSTGEIVPCPYMDMSIGNYLKEPLKDILMKGMKNKWLGPHRPDCLIGEDFEFIKFHNDSVGDRKLLPVPYGEGFSDRDLLPLVN